LAIRLGELVGTPVADAACVGAATLAASPTVRSATPTASPATKHFTLPARRWFEPLQLPTGEIGGVLVRERQELTGTVAAHAVEVETGLLRLSVSVVNCTPLPEGERTNRDAAVLRSLIFTHAILRVKDGEFVSLLEPPEDCTATAAACKNIGTWPVLVGEPGQRDTMLSSPIILYDYPQVAPESPGNLFDGSEIDEILTLRIMTLTDDEKHAAAALDTRVRDLLTRTAALGPEELSRLHGTLRNVRAVSGESA
jgi:hypothetical protein